jgi:YggT family protein
MIFFLIQAIDWVANLLILVVLVYVVISYFMSPYHQFRMWVDRIVEPMLRPIRRVVPLIGMIDISPIILFLLIRLIAWILKQILLFFV